MERKEILNPSSCIVAAFRGIHVSPAKHSYASVTEGQTDGRTDGRTDRRRTK